MERPRALLTGISSSLVFQFNKMLIDFGYEVIGLTRKTNHLLPIKQIEFDFMRGKTWRHTELSKPFDFVFHGAGHVPTTANPNYYLVNHILPLKFFSQIKFNENCKFIFASSASVYGTAPVGIVTETFEATPISDYAISKMLFEQGMPSVLKSNGSLGHFVALRIPILLGAKVSRNLIGRWINLAIDKTAIKVSNPEKKFTALVGESEILKWTAAHMSMSEPKSHTINCYTNGDLSYHGVAKLISKYFSGKKPQIIQDSTSVLMLNNTEDFWFNKISTKKTVLSHLENLKKS
jgi:nucleoside-diphosphate-sugar epimerase